MIGKPRSQDDPFEAGATASGPPPSPTPSRRAGRGRGGHGGRGTPGDGTARGGERLAAARRQLQRHRVDAPSSTPRHTPEPPRPRQQNRSPPPTPEPGSQPPPHPLTPPPPPASPRVDPTVPNLSSRTPARHTDTLFLLPLPPPRPRPPKRPAWAGPSRFTWQVEEGESGAKRRTPLPPKAQAGRQGNTQRRGGGLLRSRAKPVERNRWRETDGGKQARQSPRARIRPDPASRRAICPAAGFTRSGSLPGVRGESERCLRRKAALRGRASAPRPERAPARRCSRVLPSEEEGSAPLGAAGCHCGVHGYQHAAAGGDLDWRERARGSRCFIWPARATRMPSRGER